MGVSLHKNAVLFVGETFKNFVLSENYNDDEFGHETTGTGNSTDDSSINNKWEDEIMGM